MKHLIFVLIAVMVMSACSREAPRPEGKERDLSVTLDCGAFTRALEGYRPIGSGRARPLEIDSIRAVKTDRIVVTLANHLENSDLDVTLKISAGEDELVSRSARINANSSKQIHLDVPMVIFDAAEITAAVKPAKPDGLPPWEEELDFSLISRTLETESYKKTPRVEFKGPADGLMDKWEGMDYTLLETDREGGISARIFTGWDDASFYIAAEVDDRKHFNNKAAGQIWDGDSMQFAFQTREDVEAFNLALALASGELWKYKFRGPETGLIEGMDGIVIRDDEAEKTFYEASIPLKALQLEPEKGAIFGFSVVIFNDDSGSGQEYWIQMSPGIAGGWDPDKLTRFVLWD